MLVNGHFPILLDKLLNRWEGNLFYASLTAPFRDARLKMSRIFLEVGFFWGDTVLNKSASSCFPISGKSLRSLSHD
jgi:hypothetical protein